MKVTDDSQALNQELLMALDDVNKHPRSFDNAIDFCECGPELNQRSLVLLFRQALVFSPNSTSEVVNFLVSLVKFCSRHQVQTKFKAEWHIVKDHLDEALVKSFTSWKANRHQSKVWYTINREYLHLFLPVADCDKCIQKTGDYADVEQELCHVVASSKIGTKMLGASHRQFMGTKVSQIIIDRLTELVTKKVTIERINEFRKKFVDDLAQSGKVAKAALPKRGLSCSTGA